MPTTSSTPGFFPFPPVSARLSRALLGTWTKTATISMTAPWVIWLRLSRLAAGGATAANQREFTRMFAEKAAAVNESTAVLNKLAFGMMATPMVWTDPAAANRLLTRAASATNRSLTPFSRRVQANSRRLSRTR